MESVRYWYFLLVSLKYCGRNSGARNGPLGKQQLHVLFIQLGIRTINFPASIIFSRNFGKSPRKQKFC
jgi:hypothetical protein